MVEKRRTTHLHESRTFDINTFKNIVFCQIGSLEDNLADWMNTDTTSKTHVTTHVKTQTKKRKKHT